MFFWKKSGAQNILDALRQIEKEIRKLEDVSAQLTQFKKVLGIIDQNVAKAKEAILERAEEEKSKPWIDVKFDAEIDVRAKQEIDALETLAKNTSLFRDLAQASATHDDVRFLLDELKKDEDGIVAREAGHEKAVKDMERKTLAERLRKQSAEVPPDQTKDGIPFSSVARVVRGLGGWMVDKTRHQAGIQFPHALRPVVISPSLGTELLAKEVITQLRESGYPAHKLPNQSNLQKAFKSGDVHQTA